MGKSVVRAGTAGPADVSAMAPMERPRKSRDRPHAPCAGLFREAGTAAACGGGLRIRAFDATAVGGAGGTGALRRNLIRRTGRIFRPAGKSVLPMNGNGSREGELRHALKVPDAAARPTQTRGNSCSNRVK